MAVKYKDFLQSADDCLSRFSSSSSEIELRNAISRGYYAAFTFARQLLPALKLSSLSKSEVQGGMHVEIAQSYRAGGKSLSAVADSLSAAHKLRCLADYDCHKEVDRTLASKQLVKCRGVIHRLDQISQSNAALIDSKD